MVSVRGMDWPWRIILAGFRELFTILIAMVVIQIYVVMETSKYVCVLEERGKHSIGGVIIIIIIDIFKCIPQEYS
jgi:hypothetical protein